MFNPYSYQNSRRAGAAYLEIVQEGEATPDLADEPQPAFMPLRETELTGTVAGPVARLQVQHRFGYADQTDGPVLEAVYRFPLPGDAAVTGVRVTFGDTEITAELADREAAEREYDEARATGRQAVLLTRESPDVFSLHVSGIDPDADVLVVTEYVQLARPSGAGFSLRVPLTPAPRYTSPEGIGGRHAHGQPLAPAHDPGHRFKLDLVVRDVDELRSPTHHLDVRRDSGFERARLRDGEVVPDRDLVLEWTSHRAEVDPTLRVYSYRESSGEGVHEHDYFLAMVTPPRAPRPEDAVSREIVLLVDRSGSMGGPKWEAADWAVRRFLAGLREGDTFSVGLFHDETRWFASECVPATPDNVMAARRFVDAHRDSGGTRLEPALEEAMICGRASGDRSRHIVIITDAQVTNSGDLLRLARTEATRPDRRRISVLCIDAAPNSHLVHELVSIGGGQSAFLTSDPDDEDITSALEELLRFWDTPVESALSLVVDRPDVWVIGRAVEDDESEDGERSRVDVGDLPPEHAVWIVGRAPSSSLALTAELQRADGTVVCRSEAVDEPDAAIKQLFGARRLLALEYQLDYLERGRRSRRHDWTGDESRKKLQELLVAESLYYGLACSETSFIAARREAGKLVQRGAIVPNAIPSGWSMQSVADVDFNTVAYQAMPPASSDGQVVYSEFRDSAPRGKMDSPESPASARAHRLENRITEARSVTLFSGVPELTGTETVLLERSRSGISGRLRALQVTIDDHADPMEDGMLELYVGDSVLPRVVAWLPDIQAEGGARPVNVRIHPDEPLRLVLRLTSHQSLPSMTIELSVSARG